MYMYIYLDMHIYVYVHIQFLHIHIYIYIYFWYIYIYIFVHWGCQKPGLLWINNRFIFLKGTRFEASRTPPVFQWFGRAQDTYIYIYTWNPKQPF